MSYSIWLLLTDIGIIGFISAFIVLLGVVLGRREDRLARSARQPRTTIVLEEFIRRVS